MISKETKVRIKISKNFKNKRGKKNLKKKRLRRRSKKNKKRLIVRMSHTYNHRQHLISQK